MAVTTLGRRPIHWTGVVFEADLASASVLPELVGTVFDHDDPRRALVRISQAFGVSPLDFVGLSVKLPDVYGEGADQDFILVSSSRLPVLRRLPFPMADIFSDAFFCSGTSYSVAGRELVLGGVFRSAGPHPWQPVLGLPTPTSAVLHLLCATPRGGWHLVAEITLLRRWGGRDLALRFNPATSGGGIYAGGAVNRARSIVYRHFQSAVPGSHAELET
jgi:hypothetical protein